MSNKASIFSETAGVPELIKVSMLGRLQMCVFLLLAGSLILVFIVNPPGSDQRTIYSGLIAGLFVLNGIGMYLLVTKRCTLSAACIVAAALLGPWGSFLLDPQVFFGDFFPLVFTAVPVLLSSILFPLIVTIALFVVQLSALLMIVSLSPASEFMYTASFMAFFCILSAISIMSNAISRRSVTVIDQQRLQLHEKSETLEQDNRILRTAEEALHVSEEFQRGIISASPFAVITLDAAGKVLSWNTAAEQMFGWTAQEAIGQYPLFIPPEKFEEFDKVREQTMQGASFSQLELVRQRKDGSSVAVSLSTAPLRSRQGESSGVLAMIADITEQKMYQHNLQRQKQIFQNLFDGSPDAIALLDQDDCVIEVNKAFTDLFQYTNPEAAGRYINDLIAPEDRKKEASELTQLVTSNQIVQKETVRCRKDGSSVQVFIVGYPNFLDEFQIGVFGIYRDVTEQKRLENQLLQSQKIDSIGRLAGGIAHDFNNMLGVILGYTEMALGKLEPDESLYFELREVQTAAQRSAELTKQLLAFARKQTIKPVSLDMNERIGNMTNMLQRLIGEDISLNFSPGSGNHTIRIDPSQIDQVLVNLCINAREAIGDTGTIAIETKMTAVDEHYCAHHIEFKPGEYCVLSVSDDGKGMTEETQKNVFEPFFTTKKFGEGTGLGLSTVYGIIKQNSGHINAYSELNQGTVIRVYFPRHIRNEPLEYQEISQSAVPGNGEKVLVVDDDSIMRDMTASMLEQLNYSVLTAGNHQEAVHLAETNRDIKLLITDVVMPEMNGKKLQRAVNQHIPDVLCLFMSGYTANIMVHRGVLKSGGYFLEKPFSLDDLDKKVREVFASDQ